MNRRRILVVITLVLTIFLVALAGCQELGKTFPFLNQPTQMQPSPTQGDLQSTLFPEITATPTIEQPLQLVLWLPPRFDPGNGTPSGELLGNKISAFEEEHPGMSVQVRIKAEGGVGGLLDTLTTASAAAPAAMPDVILLSRPDFEIASRAGLLMPLESTDLQLDRSNWFPFASQLAEVDGLTYGVPFSGDIMVMPYKTSAITFPPQDWEGIYKQKSILAFPAADPKGFTAIMLYMKAGGTFKNEDNKLTLDEQALQTALQVLYEGASVDVFPFWMLDDKTFTESNRKFIETQAAYEIIWSSIFLNDKNENTAVTAIPGFNETNSDIATGWVLAIPQSSGKELGGALDLVKFFTDPLFQGRWSEAAGYIPISREALSGWSDQQVSGILMDIAAISQVLPDRDILEEVGPLFAEATQDLLKQQVSYIQASNTILSRISE